MWLLGIEMPVGRHTFRATVYDWRNDDVGLDEVGRIGI
jgi:hypothetical protein